jgi:hypothetical protein
METTAGGFRQPTRQNIMDDQSPFRQKPSNAVPTGQSQQAVDAVPSEQSGTNVRIGTPVWRSFVANKAFQESNKESIRAEQNQIRRAKIGSRRAAREERPPMFKGAKGKLIRVQGGRGEELNPEEWANDPEVGPIARRSLWEKEIDTAKRESSDSAFRLKDPAFHAKSLKDKEREDYLAEGSTLAETDARHVELKAKLAADDEYRAEKASLAQRSYDSEKRARELEATDPEQWWQSRQKPDTRVADAQSQRAEAQAASNDGTEKLRAIDAKFQSGVKGTELQALQQERAEISDGLGFIAQEAAKAEQGIEQVRTDAKKEIEGKHREIAAKFIGIGTTSQSISGQDPGTYAKAKGSLNQLTDSQDAVAIALQEAGGDIDKAIKIANEKHDTASRRSDSDTMGDNPFGMFAAMEAGKFAPAAEQLTKLKAEFDAAGVDPKDRPRIIQDAARASAWTENDGDNIRQLSTGELAINPGRVFGQRDALIAEINASGSSDAEKKAAVVKLDAMRAAMADGLANDLHYGDSRMFGIGEFRDFVEEKTAKGQVGDTAALLDEWTAKQKDRNFAFKLNDSLWTGVAKGEIGIAKTAVGTAAGVAAMVGSADAKAAEAARQARAEAAFNGEKLPPLPAQDDSGAFGLAKSLGETQSMLGEASASASKAEEQRGQSGVYGISSDLTSTVTQMLPMFVGGAAAQGLKGISQVVTAGMATSGWAAMQGYESKLSDAAEMAREAKGSDLTGEEIAAVYADGKTQMAAFLNAAQTAALTKMLPGGSERAALGTTAKSMTVRDFISKGGVKAFRDKTLKAELKAMGKTIFADATDETIEEGLNQALDLIISKAALGKDVKLGDAIEEIVQSGALGGVVGGALPQVRRGERSTTPAAPVEVAPVDISTALAAIDPEAEPASEEEIKLGTMIAPDAPAEGVLIERELTDVEAEDIDAESAAEVDLMNAQTTGDKNLIAMAEADLETIKTGGRRAPTVRAVLKIAAGQQLDNLTAAELTGIGMEETKTGFKPIKDAPVMIRTGADGSIILTDEALKKVGEISTRARDRVKMSEAEALAKAKERAATLSTTQNGAAPLGGGAASQEVPGDPGTGLSTYPIETNAAVEFDVPMRDGTVLRVQAPDAETALQEAAAVAPITGRPATPVSNEQNQKTDTSKPAPMATVPVSAVPTATDEQANTGAAGGKPAGAGPAEAQAEAQVAAPTVKDSLTVQPGKLAQAKAKTRFAKAKKRLKDRITEGQTRAEASPEGITINPKQIVDEAIALGMTEDQAAEYFDLILDEEIRHLAQYDAAKVLFRAAGSPGDFLLWMESHYAAIWQSDFAGEKGDIVRDIYAKTETGTDARWDAMSDGDKALEAIRMMSQGNAITEQGRLWTDISEGLKKALRAALIALKQFSDIASPTLQQEITNLENALKELTGTAKPRPTSSGNPQKQPGSRRASDGDGKTAEAPGNRTDAGTGEADPVRLEAPVSPLVVGARVSFVRNGVAGTGVVSYNPGNGAVRVRPDSDPAISFVMRDGDVRVIEAPKSNENTTLENQNSAQDSPVKAGSNQEPAADVVSGSVAPPEIVAEYLDTLQSLPDGAMQLHEDGMILKGDLEDKVQRIDAIEAQYPSILEQSGDLQSERVQKSRAEARKRRDKTPETKSDKAPAIVTPSDVPSDMEAINSLAATERTEWIFDKNGYVSKPGFNSKWTPEETKAMQDRFKAAGIYTSTMKASGNVDDRLVGRFRVYDAGLQSDRTGPLSKLRDAIARRDQEAIARKKKADQDAEVAQNAALLAEADQQALTWINETFGEDFANATNKAGLADYISGKVDKFDLYRVNRKWLPGLEKIGAIQGENVNIEAVRAAFKTTAPNGQSDPKVANTPRSERLHASMAPGFKWTGETGKDWARQLDRMLATKESGERFPTMQFLSRWNNGMNLPLVKALFKEAGIPSVKFWSQSGIKEALEDWSSRETTALADVTAERPATSAVNESSSPQLSATEQELKDFLESMEGGLQASPLQSSDFYKSKGLPRDKRVAFLGIADKLYDDGVRTPEALVTTLEKIGSGKFSAYTAALWNGMQSSYPDLPNMDDWASIYASLNQDATDENGPRMDEGAGEAGVGGGEVGVAEVAQAVETPIEAAAEVKGEMVNPANRRPAKEIKAEIIQRVEEEIAKLPDPPEVTFSTPKTKGGKREFFARQEGTNVVFQVRENGYGWDIHKAPNTQAKDRLAYVEGDIGKAKLYLPAHIDRLLTGKPLDSVTFKIPGDGTFKLLRNKAILQDFLSRAKSLPINPANSRVSTSFNQAMIGDMDNQSFVYLADPRTSLQDEGYRKQLVNKFGEKRVTDLEDAFLLKEGVTREELNGEAPAPVEEAPAAPAEPKPASKPKKQKGPSRMELLSNYFTPGKVVDGYGGKDRVIEFKAGEDQQWEVKVIRLDEEGARERTHSTEPSNKELIRAWQDRDTQQGTGSRSLEAYPNLSPSTGGKTPPAVAESEVQILPDSPAETKIDRINRHIKTLEYRISQRGTSDLVKKQNAARLVELKEELRVAMEDKPAMTQSKPGVIEYRGMKITKSEGVQVGYSTATQIRGKGRKVSGYDITDDEGTTIKFVDTLKEAKAYVDSYVGDQTQTAPQNTAESAKAPQIGDAALPGNSAVTKAGQSGYTEGPIYRGAETLDLARKFGRSGAHFTTDFQYAMDYANGDSDAVIEVFLNPGKVLNVGELADKSDSWETFKANLESAGVPLTTKSDLFGWSQNKKYKSAKTISESLTALSEDYSFKDFQGNLNNFFTDELGQAVFPLGFDSIKSWEFENRENPIWIVKDESQVADASNFNQPPPASSGGLRAADLPEPQDLDTFKKRGREQFEKARPLIENAEEQMKAFGSGSMGVDPKFANPGSTQPARDTFDITRVIDSSRREVRKDTDVFRQGLEYLEKYPQDVERLIYENGYSTSAESIKDYQQYAIKVYLDRKAQQAGTDKEMADVYALSFADIISGREMARAFRQRHDHYATQEERAQSQIADAIFVPSHGVIEQARAIDNPEARREFVRVAGETRIKKAKEAIKRAYGIKLEDVTGKLRDMQLVNTRLDKELMKLRDVVEKDIIKYIRAGAGPAAIKEAFGKDGVAQAEAVVTKLYDDFEAKIMPLVESGMSDEEILKMFADSALQASPLNPDGTPMTKEQMKARVKALFEKHAGVSLDWKSRKPLPTIKKPMADAEIQKEEADSADKIAQGIINRITKNRENPPAKAKIDPIRALVRRHTIKKVVGFRRMMVELGVSEDIIDKLEAEIVIERRRNEEMRRSRKPKPVATSPVKADWTIPIFTDGLKSVTFNTTDRSNIMRLVETIRSLAQGVGSIERIHGEERAKADAALAEINAILGKYGTDAEQIFESGKPLASYRFDPSDVAQVQAIVRVINAMDADWIDKGLEYSYGAMLSGTQTAMVNAGAGVHAVHAATLGRGMELVINAFVRDPMSAQFGEVKYVLRALAPGLSRAWSNMIGTWKSQHPMVERDLLAMEVDWDAHLGGALNQTKNGVIAGRLGNFIRYPMRALSAVDDFNKTLFGMAEAAAFAYRLAIVDSKNEDSPNFGMKPGDAKFERFIKIELNMPGSTSYRLGVQKATQFIFANALPGQKDYTGKVKGIRDLGDLAGKGAAALNKFVTSNEQSNMTAKFFQALLRMSFFPFQRTPFNIIRQAARYTPNPVSAFIDIPLAILDNIQAKNEATGKLEWGMDMKHRNPEIIERMSQQLQGAAAMMILMALGAGEGDEEDEKKFLLITGSQPYSPSRRPEIEARRRAGVEAYRVSFRRKDGTEIAGFSYGRIEPYATAVSATIDTLAAYKRGVRAGQDVSGIAANTLGSLVDQSKEKSFLSGLGDLVGMVENMRTTDEYREPIGRKLKQFLAGRVAMLVPNIIRQPIREADTNYRERTDSYMTELLYSVVPAGQKPEKIDPYGNEETKRGNSAGRMFDPLDIGTKNDVNPIDRMLIKWRDSGRWAKNPDENDRKPWFPSPILSAEFKHRKTGANVKMSSEQLAEFREQSGKRAMALLKLQKLDMDNPTARDVEKVKDIISQSRSDMKKVLAWKFSK